LDSKVALSSAGVVVRIDERSVHEIACRRNIVIYVTELDLNLRVVKLRAGSVVDAYLA
jgi:hypothetical protein